MPVNLRVSPKLKAELGLLAKQTRRDETELANEALEHYIHWENRMLSNIKQGLAQAERGEFVDDEEMASFFEQHVLLPKQ